MRRGEGHTSGPQFNLFSAKNEVQKFGIQGLDEKTKEEATVDLLVSLGAKVAMFKTLCLPYLVVEPFVKVKTASEILEVNKI